MHPANRPTTFDDAYRLALTTLKEEVRETGQTFISTDRLEELVGMEFYSAVLSCLQAEGYLTLEESPGYDVIPLQDGGTQLNGGMGYRSLPRVAKEVGESVSRAKDSVASDEDGVSGDMIFQMSELLMVGDTGAQVMRIATDDSITTDQKMRELCKVDRRYLGFNSKQWSVVLGVTPSAIRQTGFWQEIQSHRE